MIRLRDVTFGFPGRGDRAFIQKASLTIDDGEWVAVAGGNGSGKTTLCRLMAGIYRPSAGVVEIDGEDPFHSRAVPRAAAAVGIAFQNPDSQFVTSSVEREIVFGMENLSVDALEMDSRLLEAARVFGLGPFLARNPHTLSGGEKQRLLLASLWAMGPRTLILDEPFSFLDERGRASFLEAMRTSFRSEGKTILWSTIDVSEIELADRVIYLERGNILFDGHPRDLAKALSREMLESSLVHARSTRGAREGAAARGGGEITPLVGIRDGSFSPDGGNFVLSVPSFSAAACERIGVCGPSGSGKTTFLLACAGLLPPREGAVTVCGKRISSKRDFPAGSVAFLFQNPEDGFFATTVREEVALAHGSFSRGAGESEAIARALETVGLSSGEFLERNPYRLSQGEKRLVALASVMVLDAQLFILDEPTIFLDGGARTRLGAALERIESSGAAIIIASHDASFLRECCDRIVTLEAGKLA